MGRENGFEMGIPGGESGSSRGMGGPLMARIEAMLAAGGGGAEPAPMPGDCELWMSGGRAEMPPASCVIGAGVGSEAGGGARNGSDGVRTAGGGADGGVGRRTADKGPVGVGLNGS
jgi:hypothetical protein